MKSTVSILFVTLAGICHIGGCATSVDSAVLEPDVLSQVSSVAISPTLYINTRINLPEPPGVITGSDDEYVVPYTIGTDNVVESISGDVAVTVFGAIEEGRETNFNKRILSQFDYRKFIVEKLYKEFGKQMESKGVFTLTSSEQADAEFVLEVRRIALNAQYPFLADRLRRLTPSIHISCRLVKNPPVELHRTDSGRIEPEAPEAHPTLYRKTIAIRSFKGLPSHLKADYLKESVFKSAFNVAIEQAVTELMKDW